MTWFPAHSLLENCLRSPDGALFYAFQLGSNRVQFSINFIASLCTDLHFAHHAVVMARAMTVLASICLRTGSILSITLFFSKRIHFTSHDSELALRFMGMRPHAPSCARVLSTTGVVA